MKFITYHFRGLCERGTGNGYQWRSGFSENTPEGQETFPWMTARECQADAKARGARARFVDHSRTEIPQTELPT